ncbi:MAG: hypothetical protein SFY66_28955 [Oculatellaceae cyanobacterium bins.114]|nr:hypothetical protein [Oculatellaceae cyanobacterium bins.114]
MQLGLGCEVASTSQAIASGFSIVCSSRSSAIERTLAVLIIPSTTI